MAYLNNFRTSTRKRLNNEISAIWYGMNSNGRGLEQVVHTHWKSCRSGWPRGFGSLNTVSYSWIFTSLSVVSRLALYSLLRRSEQVFTLHQSVAQNLSDTWRSTFEIGAAQLRSVTDRNRAEIISLMCEQKPCPVWFSRRRKSSLRKHKLRGTQREYSSKPLKHSIVERILVFKR